MNIVVRQRDIKDCGVCCILALIKYYGGYVSLERLRIDAYVGKDGTSAYHIVETLKKYRFQAYGKKVIKEDLEKLYFPCIAHLEYKNGLTHFVVLLKVTRNSVQMMDPAKGKVTMKKSNFIDIWTNVIIFAKPLAKIPKLPKEKTIFKIINSLLKKEISYFIPFLWFSLIVTLCTVFISFYYRFSFEEVSSYYERTTFIRLMLIYGFFNLLKLFLENLVMNLKIILTKNIESNFLYSFLCHLFRLPMVQYFSHTKGELLARIKEAETLLSGLIEFVATCLVQLLLALCAFGIIYSIQSQIAYLLLGGVIIYFFMGLFWGRSIYSLVLKQMDEEVNFNTSLTEGLALFPTMKHLNQTTFVLERLEQSLYSYLKRNYQNNQKMRRQNFWKNSIFEGILFGSTIMGLYFVGIHQMSIFDFVLLESLLTHFVYPFEKIIQKIPNYYYLKSLFMKISDFECLEEEALDYPKEFANGAIILQDVSFSYDQFHNSLNHINIKIKKGGHVLLLGSSGSGKSTICKLLQRQLDGYGGSIMIKKKNILDYSVATIRQNITYLSQNESLMNGTIRENIIFGRNILEENFEKVCEICQIEDIVAKRAFRYEDYLRVDDCPLSGGEKQRILLARTLLNDTAIYLLDEVLSEVNNDLEESILKELMIYLKKKTVIYITHRPNEKYFDEVIKIGV